MPIAVTEDHEALRRAVERWAQTHCPPSVARAPAEAAAAADAAHGARPAPPGQGGDLTAEAVPLPDVWEKLAAQGWLGLHLPEDAGGQGFTLAELAVVLEELGYAARCPDRSCPPSWCPPPWPGTPTRRARPAAARPGRRDHHGGRRLRGAATRSRHGW